MSGAILLGELRQVQVPLLALLLMGGGAAKAGRVAPGQASRDETGPTALFPVALRRPLAACLCTAELALGLGLLLTAGATGAGTPALVARVATAVFFGTAVAALGELRARRPDAGCGCFGELSRTPVSWRVITRAVLLAAAAASSAGAAPLHRPHAGHAAAALALAAAELALLAALSPELGQALLRLAHKDPCELRDVPVTRTLAALQASGRWRRYRRLLVGTEPVDVWREGCWRFVVFPGVRADRRVDVVFAVYLAGRRPPVHVGMLDVDADFGRAWQVRETRPLELSTSL